jgi:hypothetical protein
MGTSRYSAMTEGQASTIQAFRLKIFSAEQQRSPNVWLGFFTQNVLDGLMELEEIEGSRLFKIS